MKIKVGDEEDERYLADIMTSFLRRPEKTGAGEKEAEKDIVKNREGISESRSREDLRRHLLEILLSDEEEVDLGVVVLIDGKKREEENAFSKCEKFDRQVDEIVLSILIDSLEEEEQAGKAGLTCGEVGNPE